MDVVSQAEPPLDEPLEAASDGLTSTERLGAARGELASRVVSSRVRLTDRLVEIWTSRELLMFLIRKELKVKYKGSFFGLLWSMLNPAAVLAVYYVVFKYFMKSNIPNFAIFLFSGLIVWNFFSATLNGSVNAIVANSGIVKKVSFPREILAISQVGTSLVFFFFQALVLIIFLVGFNYAPAWNYLPLIPVALIDLLLLTTAISILLSAMNVYLRDVKHLIEVLLQVWFWGIPIIYSYNRVYHHSKLLGYFFLADPVTPIVLAFQRAIYGKVNPLHTTYLNGGDGPILANYPYHFYFVMLGWVFLVGIAMMIVAFVVFSRVEGNFAEEL